MVFKHSTVLRQSAVHHTPVSLVMLVQAPEQSKGRPLARKVSSGLARPLEALQLAT